MLMNNQPFGMEPQSHQMLQKKLKSSSSQEAAKGTALTTKPACRALSEQGCAQGEGGEGQTIPMVPISVSVGSWASDTSKATKRMRGTVESRNSLTSGCEKKIYERRGTENHQTPALEGNSEIMLLKGKLKPRKVKFCAQVHRSPKIRNSFPSNSKEPFPYSVWFAYPMWSYEQVRNPLLCPDPCIPSTASHWRCDPRKRGWKHYLNVSSSTS